MQSPVLRYVLAHPAPRGRRFSAFIFSAAVTRVKE